MDELCFIRTGIADIHNEYVWSDENPHSNPLWFLFLWEYFKTKVCASSVHNRKAPWNLIKLFASEIKNTLIFKCLRISFLHIDELFVREHGGYFKNVL